MTPDNYFNRLIKCTYNTTSFNESFFELLELKNEKMIKIKFPKKKNLKITSSDGFRKVNFSD